MNHIKQAIEMTLAVVPTHDLDKDTVVIDELLEHMLNNFDLPKTFDKEDSDCLKVMQEIRSLLNRPSQGGEWYLELVAYPPKLVETILPVALVLYLINCKGPVDLSFSISKSKHWEKFVEVYSKYVLLRNSEF